MTVNAWFDFWITNIKKKTTRHNTVRNYILGHSTLAVTMNTYVHITDDEKEKEMKKFEEAFKIS